MEAWLQHTALLALQLAPGITDERARSIAQDLYAAWPEDPPEIAIGKFFKELSHHWAASRQPVSMDFAPTH